jgi:hypothetical protein
MFPVYQTACFMAPASVVCEYNKDPMTKHDLTVRCVTPKEQERLWAFAYKHGDLFRALAGNHLLGRGIDLNLYIPGHDLLEMGFCVPRPAPGQWAVLAWMAHRSLYRNEEGSAVVWHDREPLSAGRPELDEAWSTEWAFLASGRRVPRASLGWWAWWEWQRIRRRLEALDKAWMRWREATGSEAGNIPTPARSKSRR